MAKLRHGEGSVSPYTLTDGTVRWRARWWENGRLRSKSFASEQDGLDFLIDMSGSKRKGRYKPGSMMTVKEAVELHFENNADTWSPNTFATYGQIARTHIYPHIGNLIVSEITTGRLQAWANMLTKKGLSSSVVGNGRNIISGAFGSLVRMEEIERNPARGLKIPGSKRKPKLTWTREHVAAVLPVAREMHPVMETYYRVALTTAMRPGEIRALKWNDIDFDAGVITCQRTITRDKRFRQIVGNETKTQRVRSIAVPAATIKALREHRRKQRERQIASLHWKDTGLVFERGDGNMIAQQTLHNWHVAICEAAGVPQITFHGTRHTAATLMLDSGVSLKVVSDILGHSSITITADIYMHVDVDMQRAATDILGDIAK